MTDPRFYLVGSSPGSQRQASELTACIVQPECGFPNFRLNLSLGRLNCVEDEEFKFVANHKQSEARWRSPEIVYIYLTSDIFEDDIER